jgi:hypothetical protein
MQAALGKNLSIFGGAGLPRGQTIAPDFLKDFMSLIGSSYTDLQKKQTNPTPALPPTQPSIEDSQYCDTLCKNPATTSGLPYAKCFSQCIAGRQRR